MIIIHSAHDMRRSAEALRREGRRVGFVPTMGYLHEGHLSLVRHARETGGADLVVMSIYVNPTQFGPNEDFEKYPRDFEKDRRLAEQTGVDILFAPQTDDIYPDGARTMVEVEGLGRLLCGVSRPTHFRGVTTVVAKLLNVVRPHVAVFGQKDAQQCLMIRRMVRDLLMDVEILRAPIVREPDGLAMSSRNVYLTPAERRDAVCLSEALAIARRLIESNQTNAADIREAMTRHISARKTARLDYVGIVDTENLEPRTRVTRGTLIAVAVYFGTTRLIDNMLVED